MPKNKDLKFKKSVKPKIYLQQKCKNKKQTKDLFKLKNMQSKWLYRNSKKIAKMEIWFAKNKKRHSKVKDMIL